MLKRCDSSLSGRNDSRLSGACPEVTPRTLHLGSKERFGVSHKAYVQIMQLNRATKQFIGNNAKKTLAIIAMNSGYSHLENFTE
ncbi:MAG: hypothetical protein ACN4GW_07905 [Desulforhopalus sp.]